MYISVRSTFISRKQGVLKRVTAEAFHPTQKDAALSFKQLLRHAVISSEKVGGWNFIKSTMNFWFLIDSLHQKKINGWARCCNTDYISLVKPLSSSLNL